MLKNEIKSRPRSRVALELNKASDYKLAKPNVNDKKQSATHNNRIVVHSLAHWFATNDFTLKFIVFNCWYEWHVATLIFVQIHQYLFRMFVCTLSSVIIINIILFYLNSNENRVKMEINEAYNKNECQRRTEWNGMIHLLIYYSILIFTLWILTTKTVCMQWHCFSPSQIFRFVYGLIKLSHLSDEYRYTDTQIQILSVYFSSSVFIV